LIAGIGCISAVINGELIFRNLSVKMTIILCLYGNTQVTV